MISRNAFVCSVSALALCVAACSEDEPGTPGGGDGEDAGDVGADARMDTGVTDTETPEDTDSAEDGSDTADDTGPDFTPGDLYYFTSGGGVVTSEGFKATVSFGAPGLRGEISSSNYQMTVGPVSP